jgi:hypothetical protein
MSYSNLADLLSVNRLKDSRPLNDAANFGTHLGHRFSRMLNSIGHKYNFQASLGKTRGARNNNYSESSIQAYIRGVSLTQPIKVTTDNGYAYDIFDSSDYDRKVSKNSASSGQLSDPFSGETIFFNGQDEFKVALGKLEELRQNYIRERTQADLLLASAGGPNEVASILKATAPTKNGRSILELEGSQECQNYQAMMKNKVYDAIMASLSSMTLSELKSFASWIPGLTSMIAAIENQAKKCGMSSTQSELSTVGQIGLEEVKHAKIQQARTVQKRSNQIDQSDPLDFSVVNLGRILDRINNRKTRDKLDWNPTIDIA